YPVLQPPQEDVRLRQLVAVAAGDETGEEQPIERRQRATHAQVGVLAPVEQLKRLHEELHFADAAEPELQVETAPPPRLPLRTRLERADFLDRAEVEVLAPDERGQPPESLLARLQIAGHRLRLEQGEALPGRALRLVVLLERALRVDDGAAAPFGPQVEVDAEEEGWSADGARDRFRQPGIEGEVVEGLGSLRASVAVVDV